MITDLFEDAIVENQGVLRRVAVTIRDGVVESHAWLENDPNNPATSTVSMPGVAPQRGWMVRITPGTVDLVLKTGDGVVFLEGQPDGTFGGPPRTIATGVLDTANGNGVSFADCDNDGDIDVIVAGSNPDSVPPNSVVIRLLVNDGSGNFTTPQTVQQPQDVLVLNDLAAGDLNNDGRPEFALGGATTRFMTVNALGTLEFYSTATGQSQSTPTTPIAGTLGDCVLADLNADGRSDFVFTQISGGVGVRLAQTDGSLGAAQSFPGGLSNRVMVGDFNGDAKADVASHSFAASNITLRHGDGTGALSAPIIVDAPAAAGRLGFVPKVPASVVAAFLYTTDPARGVIQSYSVGPDGPVSTDRSAFVRDGGTPVSTKDAALADVNGDGYLDLVASESNTSEFNFALNAADGSGQFLPVLSDRLSTIDRIAPLRPVDGQGDDRAAVAITLNGSATGAIVRLNSTTNPTDWLAFAVFSLPQVGVDVAVADVNGDGRDDAIYCHSTGANAITVVNQQPGGSFLVGPSFAASGGAWSRVATGDVTGDGVPDVIVLDAASGKMRVLGNNGTGAFSALGSFALPPPLSANVAVGDVDGDGNADVIVGAGPQGLASGSVRVVRGDGSGGLLDSTAILAPAPVVSVAHSDIDGDGVNDLLFTTTSGSPNLDGALGFVRGTPTGLVGQPVSYHYVRGDPKGVFAADLRNPAAASRGASMPVVEVLVAGYTNLPPYEGVSILRPRGRAACVSDLNGDRVVDDSDFVIFVASYNILDCTDPTMPAGCPGDLNADGLVDDADFSIFVVAYDALLCP
ncbi:MAG: FG-GAP-like repeat-containing protein [Phycisphaerales bacterium]|nr:VCBS repeat-containing protein [Planctomycetota bacterium]